MGIIKCEQVFAGIFPFSSLFEIKMKVLTTFGVKIQTRKSKNPTKNCFCTYDTQYNNIYSFGQLSSAYLICLEMKEFSKNAL